MSTLIISDIHEQPLKLEALKSRIKAAKRVVFLGDWLDTFAKPKPTEATIALMKEFLGYDNCEFLLGNHDCHYFFTHSLFRCSGYDFHTQALVNELLTEDEKRRFKLSTLAGNKETFLISHAGYHPSMNKHMANEQDALDCAFRGEFHPIFGVGYIRGGWQDVGGPTWLDWNNEFVPLPEIKQIVGHTKDDKVRSKDGSFCIDTNLNHIATIADDGTITIEALPLKE